MAPNANPPAAAALRCIIDCGDCKIGGFKVIKRGVRFCDICEDGALPEAIHNLIEAFNETLERERGRVVKTDGRKICRSE